MPSATFLFQGITEQHHEACLNTLLRLPEISGFLAGVAFVKSSGVGRIANRLSQVAGKASFFVGIRNDITSYQGIATLLQTGVKVWAVDTATRRKIYHPKLYLAKSPAAACAVVGSANLTAGGLGLNVEASARLSFDLSLPDDACAVRSVENTFAALPRQHPGHVFRIKNEAAAMRLLEEGRLLDETMEPPPPASGRVVKDRADDLPPMPLHGPKKTARKTEKAGASNISMPVGDFAWAGLKLAWRSNPLSERDLNIPSSSRTHATGSMGLKRGSWHEEMDHRHYFRDVVFGACAWEADKAPSDLERASILAELRVKGVSHGLFSFRLTHNRDVHSKTYQQNNFMTHLSWGEAKPLIARRDLLGRMMSLYKDDSDPVRPVFLIEID